VYKKSYKQFIVFRSIRLERFSLSYRLVTVISNTYYRFLTSTGSDILRCAYVLIICIENSYVGDRPYVTIFQEKNTIRWWGIDYISAINTSESKDKICIIAVQLCTLFSRSYKLIYFLTLV